MTLTGQASECKAHKLHQRYIPLVHPFKYQATHTQPSLHSSIYFSVRGFVHLLQHQTTHASTPSLISRTVSEDFKHRVYLVYASTYTITPLINLFKHQTTHTSLYDHSTRPSIYTPNHARTTTSSLHSSIYLSAKPHKHPSTPIHPLIHPPQHPPTPTSIILQCFSLSLSLV